MKKMMNEKSSWRIPPLGTFEKQFSSLADKNFRSRRLVFVFCFLFHSSFSVTKSAGWRAAFGEKEETEDNTTLPAIQDGDSLPLSAIELLEKQTKPKPLHT